MKQREVTKTFMLFQIEKTLRSLGVHQKISVFRGKDFLYLTSHCIGINGRPITHQRISVFFWVLYKPTNHMAIYMVSPT